MTRREIEEILASLPDSSPVSDDPRVKEALGALGRDPELAAWFENQQAVDAAIRRRLKQIPIPEDLADRILSHAAPAGRLIRWRRPAAWAGIAAALAVLAGLWLAPRGADTMSRFRNDMVREVSVDVPPSVPAETLKELREAFARLGWPNDYLVPTALLAIPVEGGMALTWRDHRVSVVCQETEEEDYYWLFVVEADALRDTVETSPTPVRGIRECLTTCWRSADRVYLLVASGNQAAIRPFLAGLRL